MLKWIIKNNVITELIHNNINIIYPWGFETADSSSFFSLEDGFGYRYKTSSESLSFDNYKFNYSGITLMKEGKWSLNISDEIIDNTVFRKVSSITLEDSFFMDYVVRFRFRKEFIKYANISNKKIFHRNTNVYYQYPVDHVLLKGYDFTINISIIDNIVPEGMTPMIYVRDNVDEWVVHLRMVPCIWDKEVIKICTEWARTRPIPQYLSNLLLSVNSIRNALWYRGEKKPYRSNLIRRFLNPSAFGMLEIPKSTELMWFVKLELI